MSRETNSILLRYNINSFWSNSISSSRMLYSKQQFESFFNIILNNYFLQPLKIQYQKHFIFIYVFLYKEEKLSFIRKYLVLRKQVLNKILLRKCYNVLSNISNLKKKRNITPNILNLTNKKIMSQFIYKNLQKNINLTVFLNPCKTHNNYFLKRKKNFQISKYSSKKRFKLKLINYILKLRLLSLFCTTLSKLYNSNYSKVTIKSCLEKISNIKYPFYFKYFKSAILKQKIYMVFISFLFFKSNILNKYISTIIKKTKNKKHIKNLISFFNIIKMLFEKQIIPFSGFKFMISGRLNGKLRKGTFGFKLGSVKLMSFNIQVNYSCDIVHTQYGSFSLKLWICDNLFK